MAEYSDLLSLACALPLPEEEEECTESDSEECLTKDESDVEEYLVFDETTQVCTACDQVLESPSYGPLCTACHVFFYPDNTLLQKELDEEKVRMREQERQPVSSRNIEEIRGRSEVVSTSQNMRSMYGGSELSVNKLNDCTHCDQGCSSHSWSDSEDDELLGLALLSVYDQDMIQHNSKCFKEMESVIEDDLVENMPTESKLNTKIEILEILLILYLPRIINILQSTRS